MYCLVLSNKTFAHSSSLPIERCLTESIDYEFGVFVIFVLVSVKFDEFFRDQIVHDFIYHFGFVIFRAPVHESFVKSPSLLQNIDNLCSSTGYHFFRGGFQNDSPRYIGCHGGRCYLRHVHVSRKHERMIYLIVKVHYLYGHRNVTRRDVAGVNDGILADNFLALLWKLS